MEEKAFNEFHDVSRNRGCSGYKDAQGFRCGSLAANEATGNALKGLIATSIRLRVGRSDRMEPLN
jgi:hypothetical protein